MHSRYLNHTLAQTITTVWQKIRTSVRAYHIPQNANSISIPLGTTLAQVEDVVIKQALEACDGNKEEAAKLLGVSARTLYRRDAAKKAVGKSLPSS